MKMYLPQRTLINSILSLFLTVLIIFTGTKIFSTPLSEPRHNIAQLIPPSVLILTILWVFTRSVAARAVTVLILSLTAITLYTIQTGFIFARVADETLTRTRIAWPYQKAAWKAGQPFDSRTPLEVVFELRQKGVDAYPTIPNSLFWHPWYDTEPVTLNGTALLPLGGISAVTTVYCNENGKYLIYDSDEHGFHNPRSLYQAPVTIMAIGDSMTHGACVPSEDNAVARIRRNFPKTLNLGYGDNGPLPNLATLAEFGPELKPKIVLWFYYEGNDIDGLMFERQQALLTQYLKPSYRVGITSHRDLLDRGLKAVANTRFAKAATQKNSFLTQLNFKTAGVSAFGFFSLGPLRSFWNLLPPTSAPNTDYSTSTNPHLDLLTDVFKKSKDWTDSWNGKLMVVYLPEWANFAPPHYRRPDRKEVLNSLNALNISVIDILPVFERHADPLSLFPFRQYGHYTSEGYELVANAILDRLNSIPVTGRRLQALSSP